MCKICATICFFHVSSFIIWSSRNSLILLKEAREEQESSQEEWNVIEETIVDNIVHIHDQLFGSNDLVLAVSYLHIFTGDLL